MNDEKPKDSDLSKSEPPKQDHQKLIIVILGIVSLFGIGASAYLYYQNNELSTEIETLEKQVTTLNVQVAKLQDDQETDELVEDIEDVEEPSTEEEESETIVIRSRKVVLREEDPDTTSSWEVVETFDIDEQVEKLYVNEGNTKFVYGVYLDSGTNVYGEEIGDRYSWYLYDVDSGETMELSGLELSSEDGVETEVDLVYGWVNDNDIVVGVEGWMSLGEVAIYSVDTEEIQSISEEEFMEMEL